MPLHTIARGAKGEPDGVLVFLHGRGSDEENALALAHSVDPDERLLLVAPRAPLALPPGGAHWYQLYKLGYPDPETFTVVAPLLALWLQLLPQHTGVPLERTVLAGFSQGSMMTWSVAAGPTAPPLAGVIGVAGFVPEVPGFDLDLTRLANTPTLVTHGANDDVVGVEWGRAAYEALVTAGVPVTYVETTAAHDVDEVGAQAISDFLATVLPPR
ncbi:MAG: phospholipase [Thermoleophilia bacterium]|nr:phospholipase [Thermoleophilia bacterium]